MTIRMIKVVRYLVLNWAWLNHKDLAGKLKIHILVVKNLEKNTCWQFVSSAEVLITANSEHAPGFQSSTCRLKFKQNVLIVHIRENTLYAI